MLEKIHSQRDNKLLGAIAKNDLVQVEKLLDEGANPNAADGSGSYALIVAIREKQHSIVSLLLKAGADPDLKNKYNLSAREIAENHNHPIVLKEIRKYRKKIENKPCGKKGLFQYENGMSTKKAHIEYRQFPRMENFEKQYYKDTIILLSEEISEGRNRLKSGELGGGDVWANQKISKIKSKELSLLESQVKKPYYARLDIRQENGEVHSYYLGNYRMGEDRVFPAQSHLGSLFAQKKIGKVKDEKLGNIEVSLMRQIENENGKIIAIIDQEWSKERGYEDPVLMKRLNSEAKKKMNEIWETIQAEQDIVVRQEIDKPVIVQGSAGSGKTVIALHRLSYLLYEYKKDMDEDKVMIIGPNPMYLDYTKEALPHLAVGKIIQTTFQQYALERLPVAKLGYRILNANEILQEDGIAAHAGAMKIKGTLIFRQALADYLEMQNSAFLPKQGINFPTEYGEFSFTKEEAIRLFEQQIKRNRILTSKDKVAGILKMNINQFINKIDLANKADRIEIEKDLKKQMNSFLRKWKIPDALEIYHAFATNQQLLEPYFTDICSPEELKVFINQNKEKLKQKVLTVDDLAALLDIQYWLTGKIGIGRPGVADTATNRKFHYTIVDEAQDFSQYQLAVLSGLTQTGRMMVLGDLGQSIYNPRGFQDWKDLYQAFGLKSKNQVVHIDLSTIYRSTVEIVKFASEIIRPFAENRYVLSEPIGRNGNEPEFFKFDNGNEQLVQLENLIKKIDKDKKAETTTIALITKDWKEAAVLYEKLQPTFKNLQLIDRDEVEYEGGLIITPVYLTKGIEYDAVILTDASESKYGEDNQSRKLLYVAATRALHSVYGCYEKTLALPVLDVIDKEEANRIRKKRKEEQVAKEKMERMKKEQEIARKEREAEERIRRKKETEEQKKKGNQEHSPKKEFLLKIEGEMNRFLELHDKEAANLKEEVNQLKAENDHYRKTVKELKIANRKITAMELQKEAYFRHYLANATKEQLAGFLYPLLDRNSGERMMITLTLIQDIIHYQNFSVIPAIHEMLQINLECDNQLNTETAQLLKELSQSLLIKVEGKLKEEPDVAKSLHSLLKNFLSN